MLQKAWRWFVRLVMLLGTATVIHYASLTGALDESMAGIKYAALRRAVQGLEADYSNPFVEKWVHEGAGMLFEWMWQQSDQHERTVIRRYLELRREHSSQNEIQLDRSAMPQPPGASPIRLPETDDNNAQRNSGG